MSESFFEDAKGSRREPLRRSKQQSNEYIGKNATILVSETWYKLFVGVSTVAFVIAAIALGFSAKYMASNPLETQGPVFFTSSSNNDQVQLAQRAQMFTCAAGTNYTVSICSNYCTGQNTTLNCNTTANNACVPSVTPNGCYIVTPCDLGPWVGNEIILSGTVASSDNILEVAPTYPACPTRIVRNGTGYRSLVVTNANSLVSLLITGPNTLLVTATPVGTVTFA
jgi:archaellum component FlaF (FlaF/FlaG flagellin family)